MKNRVYLAEKMKVLPVLFSHPATAWAKRFARPEVFHAEYPNVRFCCVPIGAGRNWLFADDDARDLFSAWFSNKFAQWKAQEGKNVA